jgi:hypothetical protein
MVQRSPQEREEAGKPAGDGKQALAEHFARLEKHQPLPSFDAPGVFERGPERSGEGSGTGEVGSTARSPRMALSMSPICSACSVKSSLSLLCRNFVPIMVP